MTAERRNDVEAIRFGLRTLENGTVQVEDPAWGIEIIGNQPGDEVLLALLRHPAAKRLADVAQLSYSDHYEQRPNASSIHRLEHVVGSMVLVRKLWRKARVQFPDAPQFASDRDCMVAQIRTFISDFGHRLGSHTAESVMGTPNIHDTALPEYLEDCGVEDVLQAHGYTTSEVVFPPVVDGVECPAPDLCVDRLDYGVREGLRWVSDDKLVFGTDPVEHFAFYPNEHGTYDLVATDPLVAQRLARVYAVESNEHWGHPRQQVVSKIYVAMVRRVLVNRIEPDPRAPIPHDAMYGTETTLKNLVARAIRGGDTVVAEYDRVLRLLSAQGKAEWERNRQAFQHFIHGDVNSWPLASDAFDPYPGIYAADDTEPTLCTQKTWRQSKVRVIDPIIVCEGVAGRVSDFDPWVKVWPDIPHAERDFTIITPPSVAGAFEPDEQLNRRWHATLVRPGWSKEQLRKYIGLVAANQRCASIEV